MSFRRDEGNGDREMPDWKGSTGIRRKPGQRRGCRSCEFIDYKDIPTVKRFVNAHGKLFSRKRTQACPKCQRLIKEAVKRARFIGILSYTN